MSYNDGITYFSHSNKNFGFFYKGFGLKNGESIIKSKIKKFVIEPKGGKKEFSEPNPPEEDSDILETDSEPEEIDN